MKKYLSLLLAVVLLCTVFVKQDAFAAAEAAEAEKPITFSVSLGNNAAYYNELKQVIKENLGYEVQFIFQNGIDTSNAVLLEFKNGDLPADIMATAAEIPEEYIRVSALDLMSYTHLADYFTYQKITEFTNLDGTVYQLPFTSRLIGISYNKTLLDEMGWQVPTCFDDMLDLKKKCDEAGILFAVSAGAATGHGFNYLFHTMGAQWLSTLPGTEWFTAFMAGQTDVSEFRQEAAYFQQWVDNGLFGSFHGSDWRASQEFCSRRALFLFDLTNSVYNYEGDIVDAEGNVIGQVKDEYLSIPWISSDGSNNCYTYYDNMFLSLNKNLANPGQEERLQKCIEILEFMTTEKVTSIFKNIFKDGYVAVKTFEIDETRCYREFKDDIEQGYLMPWYYSYFDIDSIVQTGQVVNNLISDGSGTLDEAMDTLQTYRDRNLNQEVQHICTLSETLGYRDVAKLNGIGALRAWQEALDANGLKETNLVTLTPYVEQLEDNVAFNAAGPVTLKAYKGELVENDISTIIPSHGQSYVGIRMTGKEMRELAAAGLTVETTVYPYMAMGKTDTPDEETCLVLVATSCLSAGLYDQYLAAGSVVTVDDKPLTVSIRDGVRSYLLEHENLSAADLDKAY